MPHLTNVPVVKTGMCGLSSAAHAIGRLLSAPLINGLTESAERRVQKRVPHGVDLCKRYLAACPSGNLFDQEGRIEGVWHIDGVTYHTAWVMWIKRGKTGLTFDYTNLGWDNIPTDVGAKVTSFINEVGVGQHFVSTEFDMRSLVVGSEMIDGFTGRQLGTMAWRRWQTNQEDFAETNDCGKPLAECIAAFRATLDPEALSFVRRCASDPMLMGFHKNEHEFENELLSTDTIWGGIDNTFTPGAPLRLAVETRPEISRALRRLWLSDPASFCKLDSRELAIHALRSDRSPSDQRAAMSRFMAARIVDESLNVRDGMYGATYVPPPSTLKSLFHGAFRYDDPFAHILRDLPPEWTPTGADEWAAFFGTAPAIEGLWRMWTDVNQIAFFDARGRWRELADRIERVVERKQDDVGSLASACRNCRDPLARFQSQILVPALALAGEDAGRSLFKGGTEFAVARPLLYGAKCAVRVLGTSALWHARQATIAAEVATFAPLPNDGRKWESCLSDFETSGIAIKVLTSPEEMVDEGRKGLNADGTNGLNHCVAGYVDDCLRGDSVIVSLRRRKSNRPDVRLSTAQIGLNWRTLQVLQHFGEGNSQPSRECDKALETYLYAMRDRKLQIARDWSKSRSDTSRNIALEAAGYDFRKSGAWETARDAWERFLPRYARTWSAHDFAAFARTALRERN